MCYSAIARRCVARNKATLWNVSTRKHYCRCLARNGMLNAWNTPGENKHAAYASADSSHPHRRFAYQATKRIDHLVARHQRWIVSVL